MQQHQPQEMLMQNKLMQPLQAVQQLWPILQQQLQPMVQQQPRPLQMFQQQRQLQQTWSNMQEGEDIELADQIESSGQLYQFCQ